MPSTAKQAATLITILLLYDIESADIELMDG